MKRHAALQVVTAANKRSQAVIVVLGIVLVSLLAPLARSSIPDVKTDDRSTSNSPLTLKGIYQKGYTNYRSAAKKAKANLAANDALAGELKTQAGISKILSELSLIRICAIESQCSLEFAYSKPAYKGFYQIGKQACEDVAVPFDQIDDPTEWKKSCDVGRRFLEKSWQRLEAAGAKLKDGERPSLALLYLTHQLGPAGGPSLFKNLDDGSAKSLPAKMDHLANIPPTAKAAMEGSGHVITQLEFYAYWAGAIDAICDEWP